jgi:hypothetical protein
MATTLNDLISQYNALATAAGLATRRSFESKAKAEAAIAALSKTTKPKIASGATLRVRKAGAVREKGPRGFKFGPVWLASIKSGKGVALKPTNIKKVLETAEAKGVTVSKDLTQAAIVALIAKAI